MTGILFRYSFVKLRYTEKKLYWIYSISAKSMYIIDSNQYVIELVAYVSVLLASFYWINNIHDFGRNSIDSIAFFSQCRISKNSFTVQ